MAGPAPTKGTVHLANVAQLMADGDTLGPGGKVRAMTAAEIAERLGLRPSYVRLIQTRLRQQIDAAQRAAGYGPWAI